MSFPLLEFHLLEYNGTWYGLLAHFGRTNSFCIYISFLVYTDILNITVGQVRKLITILLYKLGVGGCLVEWFK